MLTEKIALNATNVNEAIKEDCYAGVADFLFQNTHCYTLVRP